MSNTTTVSVNGSTLERVPYLNKDGNTLILTNHTDTGLIKNRWSTRKNHGYQAMAVLTVVTYETLPLPHLSRQIYTLNLRNNLIWHFWHDKWLTSKSTHQEDLQVVVQLMSSTWLWNFPVKECCKWGFTSSEESVAYCHSQQYFIAFTLVKNAHVVDLVCWSVYSLTYI